MTIEVALLISLTSVAFSVYFGLRNNKRSDTKEIEQRVAERTETNMKLDQIGKDVQDIKYDISATKKSVNSLTERVASVESSVKSAHHRLDTMEGKKAVED